MIPDSSILFAYAAYSLFLFYMQLHIRRFRGASLLFLTILNTFVLAATIGKYGFLVAYAYYKDFTGAAVLFVMGLVLSMLFIKIEVRLSQQFKDMTMIMSMIGFIVIPTCAYMLYGAL